MKKFIAISLAAAMLFSFAACGNTTTAETDAAAEVTEDASAKDEGVMTYADYQAAEIDSQVVIEAYVQAKQSWWDNSATVYLQDADGAYFAYNMACSESDYALLVEGQKIKVTGYKAEWSGEIEIADATFEIIDGNWIAPVTDVTDMLGSDDIINYQNQKVSFTGMTVEASTNADGEEVPYLYNWDGSGAEGDDLYFNVSYNGQTYSFTVESYLTGADTDVYAAVKNLQVGDTVNMEGFLYWYEGVNPHITSVSVG